MPLNAEETAGRFRVWLFLDGKAPVLVWDRKVEGSFPELKVLVSVYLLRILSRYNRVLDLYVQQKQRIRDHVQPGKSLGHSDK